MNQRVLKFSGHTIVLNIVMGHPIGANVLDSRGEECPCYGAKSYMGNSAMKSSIAYMYCMKYFCI